MLPSLCACSRPLAQKTLNLCPLFLPTIVAAAAPWFSHTPEIPKSIVDTPCCFTQHSSLRFVPRSTYFLRQPPIFVSSLSLLCAAQALLCADLEIPSVFGVATKPLHFLHFLLWAACHRIFIKLPDVTSTLLFPLSWASVIVTSSCFTKLNRAKFSSPLHAFLSIFLTFWSLSRTFTGSAQTFLLLFCLAFWSVDATSPLYDLSAAGTSLVSAPLLDHLTQFGILLHGYYVLMLGLKPAASQVYNFTFTFFHEEEDNTPPMEFAPLIVFIARIFVPQEVKNCHCQNKFSAYVCCCLFPHPSLHTMRIFLRDVGPLCRDM